MHNFEQLPSPARYYPLEKGVYEVAPSLRLLGTDFGNGDLDKGLVQWDTQFRAFRENKVACRRESLEKYYRKHSYDEVTAGKVAIFLIERFLQTAPALFQRSDSAAGIKLDCLLTGESLSFDPQGNLLRVSGQKPSGAPPYLDALDALAAQCAEDLAVARLFPDGRDALVAGHICSPSHWAIGEKIGMDFVRVHEPVPGAERMNKTATQLVNAAIHKGPYTRFVWSFVTHTRLNQVPQAPAGVTDAEWKSPPLDLREECPFYLRIERQVTWGLPEIQAFVFSIRVSFRTAIEIRDLPRERELLKSTLRGMTSASKKYKRVPEDLTPLFTWLG